VGGGHAARRGWALARTSARGCTRQGRPGSDKRALATVPGGLNLIQNQIQTDSNHSNF
jgi:hypothetical protein